MITVILCGSEKDSGISTFMCRALTEANAKTEFFIRECSSIPDLNKQKGILIFKNSFSVQENANLFSGNFTPVLDAQNCKAAAVLNGSGKAAITCGMSVRDTLSIASLDYNKAVVSVQRNILTLSSKVVEPHDFTVSFQESIGVYPLLATCAVFLLADISSNEGYCI